MILGGGPNRIGQGIEFDYTCVHAAFALRDMGYESIMVNCNPETVSTDYDTSDRLYFEPVTLEDVLEIVELEKPVGVIVQYGGQTPLKLAKALEAAGVPIIGTSPDSIDIAEDRERFQKLLHRLDLLQPPNRTARTEAAAIQLAQEIGYPLVVRPSYVLGGRAMEIVHEQRDLERYMREAVKVSMDEMAKSLITRHAKREKVMVDSSLSLSDVADEVSNALNLRATVFKDDAEAAHDQVTHHRRHERTALNDAKCNLAIGQRIIGGPSRHVAIRVQPQPGRWRTGQVGQGRDHGRHRRPRQARMECQRAGQHQDPRRAGAQGARRRVGERGGRGRPDPGI